MNKEFEVHRLNSKGMELAKGIADVFDKALDQLSTFCAPGREFTIMRTKLEEACFFAKKAMASDGANCAGSPAPDGTLVEGVGLVENK